MDVIKQKDLKAAQRAINKRENLLKKALAAEEAVKAAATKLARLEQDYAAALAAHTAACNGGAGGVPAVLHVGVFGGRLAGTVCGGKDGAIVVPAAAATCAACLAKWRG